MDVFAAECDAQRVPRVVWWTENYVATWAAYYGATIYIGKITNKREQGAKNSKNLRNRTTN